MGVLLHLAGAVALLLWGIRMVQTGFSRLLGSRLERLLRRTTGNRAKAFATGAGAAFMLQSSTAVVLMLGGFTASGMLKLPAALATVLGAELGSSLAAFLLNLDVQVLALPLVLVGLTVFKRSGMAGGKHLGRILIGLGILLLALGLIGQITGDLRASDVFRLVIDQVEGDAGLAILLMAMLTWLIHSTLAAVLIVAQFVDDGTVSLAAGLYLLLGANLGGALPALLAGWSLKSNGRQVAIGNLAFRIVAVLLGLVMIMAGNGILIQWLPTGAMGVVVAHTLLNLVNGLVLLLTFRLWLPLLERPSRQGQQGSIDKGPGQPIYLAMDDIDKPGRAMANVRNEAQHMADIVYRMLNYSLEAFSDGDLVQQISALDDHIDRLHREALNYVASIDGEPGSRAKTQRQEILTFMTNLEHIGDIIDASLMLLARNKQRQHIHFDEQQKKSIRRLHEQLVDSFRLSQAVFTSNSPQLARELLSVKRRYRSQILAIRDAHLDDLPGHHSSNMISTQIFMDVLRDLMRICSHLTAVAYPILERDSMPSNNEESESPSDS